MVMSQKAKDIMTVDFKLFPFPFPGICQCTEQFDGAACSLKKAEPPTLIQDTVLIDLRLKKRQAVIITGTGFTDSKTLMCRLQEMTVNIYCLFTCFLMLFLVFLISSLCKYF